jgi:hypothetical protein
MYYYTYTVYVCLFLVKQRLVILFTVVNATDFMKLVFNFETLQRWLPGSSYEKP